MFTTPRILCAALLLASPQPRLSAQATAPAASKVQFEVRFSKPLAVFVFLRELSPKAPANPYKTLFTASEFNTPSFNGLIAAFDSIPLDIEYDFPAYPAGQKIGGSTGLTLERNLVISKDLLDFRMLSIGIIPLSDLNRMVSIIREFTPVYDKVVYDPVQAVFQKQLRDIDSLIVVKNIGSYFDQAWVFYRASWDPTIPFVFVFYPLPNARGFTAMAFGNLAVSALPTSYTDYTGVLSVMLHEASHILFDEQSLEFKKTLDEWFTSNPSRYSRYAYGLLNESWATAVGNGYFAEKLRGSLNPGSWYNWKYNSQMAKEIYPLVKQYLDDRKPMDKALVDQYVAFYETKFPDWIWQWDNLMTGRTVMSENKADFDLIDRKFPYRHAAVYLPDFSESSFQALKKGSTKLIIVSGDNRRKLDLIKSHFPELHDWNPDPHQDFSYAHLMADKWQLIVINLVNGTLDKALESRLESEP
jgi:hypothetical protein